MLVLLLLIKSSSLSSIPKLGKTNHLFLFKFMYSLVMTSKVRLFIVDGSCLIGHYFRIFEAPSDQSFVFCFSVCVSKRSVRFSVGSCLPIWFRICVLVQWILDAYIYIRSLRENLLSGMIKPSISLGKSLVWTNTKELYKFIE